MYLSTDIKTDLVIMRDKTKIPVNKEDYNRILLAKQDGKRNDLIVIMDGDKKVFHGEIGEITGFEEISHKDYTGVKWYCGYGSTHAVNEVCKCGEFYKMSQGEFRAKAYELFGSEKTIYMQDLTKEQKKEVLLSNK